MNQKSQANKILIANTDSSMSKHIYEGIKELGSQYAIDIVEFGTEAIEKAAEQRYPLLITGSFLPDMTGFNLARSIKFDNPETEILLITPNNPQNFGDLANMSEIDHLIQKPISIAQIQYLVKKVFKRAHKTTPSVVHSNYVEAVEAVAFEPFDSCELDSFELEALELDSFEPAEFIEPKAQVPAFKQSLFETGTTGSATEIYETLQQLKQNTNGRCAMLLSSSGHVVECVGDSDRLDVANISALVAANFMATLELAKLVGNSSLFKSSYHAGLEYDIFSYGLNNDYLLVVIFDTNTKVGLVRFCVKEISEALISLLQSNTFSIDFSDSQIELSVQQELDKLFLS